MNKIRVFNSYVLISRSHFPIELINVREDETSHRITLKVQQTGLLALIVKVSAQMIGSP